MGLCVTLKGLSDQLPSTGRHPHHLPVLTQAGQPLVSCPCRRFEHHEGILTRSFRPSVLTQRLYVYHVQELRAKSLGSRQLGLDFWSITYQL